MNWIPGWGRCLGEGNGNPPQYSCLGNPMDRGAWRATVHGVPKELDMKWQSTAVQLPGKSHGQRSLVGYSPRGSKEPDTTEQLHFHFHLATKQQLDTRATEPMPAAFSFETSNYMKKIIISLYVFESLWLDLWYLQANLFPTDIIDDLTIDKTFDESLLLKESKENSFALKESTIKLGR